MIDRAGSTGLSVFLIVTAAVTSFRGSRDVQDLELGGLVRGSRATPSSSTPCTPTQSRPAPASSATTSRGEVALRVARGDALVETVARGAKTSIRALRAASRARRSGARLAAPDEHRAVASVTLSQANVVR